MMMMMTPKEHYEEAERLLAQANETDVHGFILTPAQRAERLTHAEVHSRLANCPDWSVRPTPAP